MASCKSLARSIVALAAGALLAACTSTSESWPPPGAEYRGPSGLDVDAEEVWKRLDEAEATTPPAGEPRMPSPEEPWSLTADLERAAAEPPPKAEPRVTSRDEPGTEPVGAETGDDAWARLLRQAESGETPPPSDPPPAGTGEDATADAPAEPAEPAVEDAAEEPLSIATVLGPERRRSPPPPSDSTPSAEPSPASEGATTEPAPTDATEEPSSERPVLAPTEARERVARLLTQLSGDETAAKRAFRDLWEIPRECIPALIREVENDRPTPLTEISVLVLDTERFARLDEVSGKLTYTVPGMGRFRHDDVAAGRIWDGRAIKAVFRDLEGFPVGVVVRAALVNRFRSTDYPDGDDRPDPVRWWQRFYERVASKL